MPSWFWVLLWITWRICLGSTIRKSFLPKYLFCVQLSRLRLTRLSSIWTPTTRSQFETLIFFAITQDVSRIGSWDFKCPMFLVDWRVRPLVCVIKEWAKRRGINNANQSSLTSYSLVLMAIHYLQCGVKAPILPSLQQVYHNRFNAKIDVRNLDISYPLEQNRNWENSKNLMSLSELLKGFFNYYAYDFE